MMGYLKCEQSNQASLYDRVKKLLVSYEWSDCKFLVDDFEFKAHKLILGISSPVFEAMFYGPLSNSCDIVITDIQPDTFQLILNYIYTDTVEISCVEQAFKLLYASRKYMLDHLTEICVSFIKANISIDNVVDILNYPEYMQEERLLNFSLRLFCEHAHYVLEEKKSLITYTCMRRILNSNQMNIEEKYLIKHVFEWSRYFCEQNNIPVTIKNRRNMLKNKGLFKLLRFLSLSINDLEAVMKFPDNLLSIQEYDNLKNVIKTRSDVDSCEKLEIVEYNTVPRMTLKMQWFLCYRSSLRSIAPIVIDSNNHVIQCRIKSSKSVFINSLGVSTRSKPDIYFSDNAPKVYSEQLSVSIACETDNSIIKHTNFMNTVEYSSAVNIELTEPIFIKKDHWYRISFVWPKNSTCTYFVEYKDKKYTGHKVTIEFDDLPYSAGNSGSFLRSLKFCL